MPRHPRTESDSTAWSGRRWRKPPPEQTSSLLPEFEQSFINAESMAQFAAALVADATIPEDALLDSGEPGKGARGSARDGVASPSSGGAPVETFSAFNDWSPIREKVSRKRKQKPRADETREGVVYAFAKWPLLVFVAGWIVCLAILYMLIRFYIFWYENIVTWRGRRQQLRQRLRASESYEEWIEAAKELDRFLGNDKWMERDEYGYYDSRTIQRVGTFLRKLRERAEQDERTVGEKGTAKEPDSEDSNQKSSDERPVDKLRSLLEACVKANFAGTENAGLYSETYYGTKKLLQLYLNEVEESLQFLIRTRQLARPVKRAFFRHLHTNIGRSALCLSGGATLAYYHFGVVRALLDADLLPDVISGTSGGALVAAFVATRTNTELDALILPALADKITACHEGTLAWIRRWWQTGARFDSVDWAERSTWFCRGDTTFREAFERTGRVLNVSCVPSDPHSPTMLVNYLTAPDCVIWSAVLASAAVPGILNPVVLMRKVPSLTSASGYSLQPLSFGHKWKDGSLRTDIPLRALNLNFGVHFPVVSQVNPHVSLFFFSSRGSVGRPVTHRKGRGWRGGFMGSAIEQYLKLDLTKWLKVLRHLELLPRPLGQDWSSIWLQRFSGTVTVWPKSVLLEDLVGILSDPSRDRLGRMITRGRLATWPKLLFIQNRARIERAVERGERTTRNGEFPEREQPVMFEEAGWSEPEGIEFRFPGVSRSEGSDASEVRSSQDEKEADEADNEDELELELELEPERRRRASGSGDGHAHVADGGRWAQEKQQQQQARTRSWERTFSHRSTRSVGEMIVEGAGDTRGDVAAEMEWRHGQDPDLEHALVEEPAGAEPEERPSEISS